MRNTKWVGLVAALALPLLTAHAQTPEAPVPGAPAQAQAAVPVNLSPGAAEVARLAGSGVGDDVVLAYIQNSQAPFTLSADDVLYLNDIGLSPQVTSAMLSHDNALRGQPQQYAPAAPAPAAPPPVAEVPVAQPAPPPAVAPPPAYVTTAPADVSYFYNDLSPYGTWVSLEGYGWCWQPQTVVIARGWRPYCDGGHWVYSDAGWFWQSDYSWGWAPFHYGRWYQHPRCGWVWTPDRVWGPAWVTWRTGGDVCGWAPLPPHASFDVRLGWRYNGVSVGASFDFGLGIGAFAFVGFGDFGNHDLGHRRLPPERVTTIYRQTTIVNNYVVVNNNIVHRGIPLERVTAASRVPVPRATVRDLPAGSARTPSRTASVVYRPQLQAPARPVKMVAQQVDTRNPVIQHAPIAPVNAQRSSTLSRTGSAPGAASRQPAVQAPRTSTWSSGAKPASSPQYQPTSKTPQPAATSATPRTSTWSNGAKPASSSQYQPTSKTPQPAATSATPRASPWSSGAKPLSSSQSQSTSRTYQPVTKVPPAATTPRAPDEWKQGTRAAPGYRSDAGLPSIYNARTASESSSATVKTTVQPQNSHVYQPKSQQQAAEIRALPQSNQRPSASPSSTGKSMDSKSGKKQ
ncbi:MAG TPA: DUF6600 domain-containing protein [Verrucomicrobiae bacterium]